MIFGSRAVTARRRKPRDRQTDRQTDRQKDRQRQTDTDRQRQTTRERERGMNIHIVSCTHKFLASRFQLFLSSGIQHGFR